MFTLYSKKVSAFARARTISKLLETPPCRRMPVSHDTLDPAGAVNSGLTPRREPARDVLWRVGK